ncbi:MAG: hypothetical protein C0503_02845 [Gemmatimonas sp.]|nr:hypothetical protein [Gemmatimonas sp.]
MATVAEPGRGYTRGPALVRWLYLIWRQALAFLDLLGEDGRPSSTKLTAAAVIAVCLTVVAKTLAATAGIVTLIIAALAALFGRRHFRTFLERWQPGKTGKPADDPGPAPKAIDP